jgi:hypothetical protein
MSNHISIGWGLENQSVKPLLNTAGFTASQVFEKASFSF